MTILPMTRPAAAPEPPWTAPLLDLLADGRGRTTAEVAAAMSLDTAEVERELRARGDVHERDGRWTSALVLAEGLGLVHQIGAEELALGVVTADGDLDLWAQLADDGVALAGGGSVRTRWSLGPDELPAGAYAGLVGPEGWLADVRPDSLVTFRLRSGRLVVEPDARLEDPGAGAGELVRASMPAAQSALLRYTSDPDEAILPGAFIADVLLDLLRSAPDALPVDLPPLGALLEFAGLEVHNGMVGLPGTDWEGRDEALDLTAHERYVLACLRSAFLTARRGESLPEPATLAGLARMSHHDALLDPLGEQVAADSEVEPLLLAMAEAADGAWASGPYYLLSRVAEGLGDVLAQERHLHTALELDADMVPALRDAAELAADRGDAVAADGVRRRTGMPSDQPWRAELRPLLQPPPGDVARNRPCPCGSGRKYKACHLRDLRHPLPLRAGWLYSRALQFALRPRAETALVDLAVAWCGSDPGRLAGSVFEPLVLDLGLFEGGLLEQYLHDRGQLLPADERALAESWLGTPLAAYEVVRVTPGRSVVLRPLPEGQQVELRDRLLSEDVQRLDVLLGRLLPNGVTVAFLTSPELVDRMRRRDLLTLLDGGYEAADIAAFFSPRGLPRVQTTEGNLVKA